MRELVAVDLCIPILGLISTVALFGAGLRPMAEGCLAGAVLASVDWLLLRVLMDRIFKKGKRFTLRKMISAAVLGFKFIFLAVFIYFVIYKLNFSPYGVAVGVGSLPLGIIAGAVLSTRRGKEKNNNA